MSERNQASLGPAYDALVRLQLHDGGLMVYSCLASRSSTVVSLIVPSNDSVKSARSLLWPVISSCHGAKMNLQSVISEEMQAVGNDMEVIFTLVRLPGKERLLRADCKYMKLCA